MAERWLTTLAKPHLSLGEPPSITCKYMYIYKVIDGPWLYYVMIIIRLLGSMHIQEGSDPVVGQRRLDYPPGKKHCNRKQVGMFQCNVWLLT